MFLNAIMLAGIAGAVVPLVLHLLSRARSRRVQWGAMMFLQTADARQRRSTRLKQWILLCIRMALVSLLAIALARPIAAGGFGAFGQSGSATAVILFDHSASMSVGRPGHTRLDEATADAVHILASLHHGDQAALVLLGEQRAAPIEPTSDLQSLIDSLHGPQFHTAGGGVANIPDGLNLAADIFAHSPNPSRKLFLVCDRQALNWREVSDKFAATWRARIASASPGAPAMQFTVIPVGAMETGGIAVQSVSIDTPQIIAGQPTAVEVTVHNFGQSPAGAVKLTLYAGDAAAATTTLKIPPSSSATAHQSIRIDSPGSQVLTARLGDSGDRVGEFSLAIDVVKPIDVLLIHPESQNSQPVDFLRLALTPFSSTGHHAADIASVQVMNYSPGDDWSSLAAKKFRVIVLDNLPQLAPAQAKALEQHVYSGGGLLVSPGPATGVENLNDELYRQGAGILPASLGRAISLDAAGITGIDRLHPIFNFLSNLSDPDSAAAIGRYFPVLAVQNDARVLATVGASPLLIAGNFGSGRVVLVTTPLNQPWNTLARTSFFLPLVQSTVRYLASSPNRNLKPGQPIVARFNDNSSSGSDSSPAAQILMPSSSDPLPISLQPAGEGYEARFSDTAEPGIYTVTLGSQKYQYVVSAPRDEADLTPLTPKQWQTFSQQLGFAMLDISQAPIDQALVEDRSPRELWEIVLVLVVALAVSEILLESIFSQTLDVPEMEPAA